MRLKRKLGVAAALILTVVSTGGAIGGIGPAAAATGQFGGTWGTPQPVPGLAALGGNSNAVASIDCGSTGNCAAVGWYVANGTTSGTVPFAVNESGGVWGTAQAITGIPGAVAAGNNGLTKVVCTGPNDCTAAGTFISTNGTSHMFLVSESGGTWGTPTALDESALTGATSSSFGALSCPAGGDCAAVGIYYVPGTGGVTIAHAFAVEENAGVWGQAQAIATPAATSMYSSGLTTLSCSAPGECTAGGVNDVPSTDPTVDGLVEQPALVTESGHSWGQLEPLPGFTALNPGFMSAAGVTSIACPTTGNCAAIGTAALAASSAGEAFTIDEANGNWGQAQLLSPATTVGDATVACRAAGDCVVAFQGASVMTATETTAGAWSALTAPSGQSTEGVTLEGLTCTTGGDCVVAGWEQLPGTDPAKFETFTATSPAGAGFGAIQPVLTEIGQPTQTSFACPQTGYCVLSYRIDGGGNVQSLLNEATADTLTLTPSATRLNYGAEQSEVLTAAVSSPAGGTPTGTVTVTSTVTSGKTPLCVITLVAGSGSCTLTPEQLPPSTAPLSGSYSGDVTYLAATAPTPYIFVVRAPTVTSLSVTPASTMTFGNEQAGQLSVTVTSAAGTPTGTVLVQSGTATLCTVTLASGSGSCSPGATALPAGKASLTASYLGDATNAASASATVPVTVAAQPVAVGAEGSDGGLWVQAPRLGAGWHSLGGQISAPPAVAAPAPSGTTLAQPLFLATATNHELYIRSLTSGWQQAGPAKASCIGQPAAVVVGTRLTVGCRGLNNALWENSATVPASGLPQFTRGWTSLGGTLTAGPAVAPVGGTLTFFAPLAGGKVSTRTLAAGYQVTPWVCTGSPAAASAAGVTTFACQGANHALWEAANPGTGWTAAAPQGGALVGGPALAALSTGTASLVEGTNKAAWELPAHGIWISLGGSITGGIGAAALG